MDIFERSFLSIENHSVSGNNDINGKARDRDHQALSMELIGPKPSLPILKSVC